MIHVASLLHDDVIDAASTRRGLRALNIAFGNKACATNNRVSISLERNLYNSDCRLLRFVKPWGPLLKRRRIMIGCPCRQLQVAILAGDFLLARASVSLAALRDTEVIELLSQVIEHLVSGEILQVRSHSLPICLGRLLAQRC